ncbi:MAG: L-asparagine oxygenase [Acidimicrobiaceae bacterium]|jgi:hypothetical protein|nr:L-asparagine oxygenase [Acidimicrobiaceae bacterium]
MESSGRLVHSIAPIQANQHLQISSSSSAELEMRTELAYAEHVPDFVLLLCARQGTESAATLVAPLCDIARELPDAILRILHEPRFMTSVDLVVRGRAEQQVGPLPLLYIDEFDDVTIRCDFGEEALRTTLSPPCTAQQRDAPSASSLTKAISWSSTTSAPCMVEFRSQPDSMELIDGY